jgi:threonyl-tRNA synthetase
MENGMISVRKQGEGDLGSISIENFANLVKDEISKSFV